MAGRLYASWGTYDHGALHAHAIAVHPVRDVQGIERIYEGESHDAEVTVPAGTPLVWNPGQRNYDGFVDLSTHAVLGDRECSHHTLRVPWSALALSLPPPWTDGDEPPSQAQLDAFIAAFGRADVVQAANHLLDALDTLADWLADEPWPDEPSGTEPDDRHPMTVAPLPFVPHLPVTYAAGDQARPTDLAESVHALAGHLRDIAWTIAARDPETSSWMMQADVRASIDLPSLLTRARYAPDAVAARRNQSPLWFQEHHAFWIGDDDEPGAIAPSHPWVIALEPLWRRVMADYAAWVALLPP